MTAGLQSQRWWMFLSFMVLCYFASVVFVPLILAIFSAMLLWPAVYRLTCFKVPRVIASFFALAVFTSVLGFITWAIVYSAADIASSLPAYSQHINEMAHELANRASAFEIKSAHIFAGFFGGGAHAQKVQLVEALPPWSGFLLRSAGSVSEFISIAFFVPLLILYFLQDKENLVESLDALVGKFAYLPKLHAELPRMIRNFVLGNMAAGLFMGVTQTLILYLLGYENWASLGLVSGILNLVPLLGAPLAMALPFCQAIIQFHDWPPFAFMALSFLFIHFLTNNILLPLLIGAQTNINPTALTVGLLFWSWLWGISGFLLAIPLTSCLKIFLESHPDTLPLANLMAAKPRILMKAPPPLRN